LDRDEYRAHLLARWPGLEVRTAPLGKDYPYLVYHLPPQPVCAAVDPEAPGGLRWYPLLKWAWDDHDPPMLQCLPEISDMSVHHSLSQDGWYLFLNNATETDCAATVSWLRAWIPPDIPLVAKQVHDEEVYCTVNVRPGTTIVEVVRGLLGDQRVPCSVTGLPSPPDLLSDREIEALVRQVLGDEAHQFYPTR